MGKRGQKSLAQRGSSSEDEEDPTELLAKLARQKRDIRGGDEQSSGQAQLLTRPPARANGIFVANPLNSEEVLLFGGEHFDGNRCHFYGDTLLFNTRERTWTDLHLSIAPSPRSAHQAVVLGDGSGAEVLMFGGEFGTSRETKFLHFSDTWIFDFTSHTWRALTLKEHPASRSGHRMARWGDCVVLFGGFQDTGQATRYLDDLWFFSLSTRQWRRVDWMNEYEGRPSARSGFSFIPHPEGVLLYGGYTQTRDKSGAIHGHSLNDLWLLRLDREDEQSVRWKKLKLGPGAPPPRSGSSSVAAEGGKTMINLGGVIDDEPSEEHLVGTCVNACYRYTFEGGGSWEHLSISPVEAAFDMDRFCGRFNSMLAVNRDGGRLLIYGGIHEVGDRQFTLDDLYELDLAQGRLSQLQALSPPLEGCWKQGPISGDEDDGDDDDEYDDDDDEDDDEDDTDGDSDNDSDDDSSANETTGPKAARYETLKEYFDDNVEYWMDAARSEHAGGEVTDKQLRSAAFMIAKRCWSEQQELSMNICL